MSKTRTFIAIALSPEALASLADYTRQLRARPEGQACRWADLDTVHLTLRFLGDVDAARLYQVYKASDQAARQGAPFSLDITGLGCFPNTRQPRIVWAGVGQGSNNLETLARDLERKVQSIGFEPERRPYHPHITLGRARRGAPRDQIASLGQVIAGWPKETVATLDVREIIVFGSELTPAGPIHTRMHESPLRTSP